MTAGFAVALLGTGLALSQSPPAIAGAPIPTAVTVAPLPMSPDLALQTSVVLPDTPLGRQVAWVVEVSSRLPAPEAEIIGHFSPAWRDMLDPAAFNQALAENAGPTGLVLLRYQELSPQVAELVATGGNSQWTITVFTDSAGFLQLVAFKP
jgi:hypothetical protein